MRRIICIILWSLGFFFVFSMAGGLIAGILIGFTDIDVEKGAARLVGMIDLLGLFGLALGLVLGIREALPGTKRPRPEQGEVVNSE